MLIHYSIDLNSKVFTNVGAFVSLLQIEFSKLGNGEDGRVFQFIFVSNSSKG